MNADGRTDGRKKGRKARWCGKFLISNLCAVSLFSFVGYFYNFGGLPLVTPIANETLHRSPPYERISRATEGGIYARHDANGYNNAYYLDLSRDLKEIDILTIGSSHIEGYSVGARDNLVYCLNQAFANDGEETLLFYNCGRSGHHFGITSSRYEYALKLFAPKKYALLEVAGVPNPKEMERSLKNEFQNDPPVSAWVSWICKNIGGASWGLSVLRAARKNRETKNPSVVNLDAKPTQEETEIIYAQLARRIVETSKKYGVTPILFFHKNYRLEKDGLISPRWDVDELAAFRAICEREGIVFVDATERFREEYEKNNVWPYGFCNAGIISGHLNRDGHRMIADVLEEKIRELEAENKESEAQQ